MLEQSKIPHATSWFGLQAAIDSMKEEMLELYYISVVNADLTRERQSTKKFGEGEMQVTVETFWRWPNKLPEKSADEAWADHQVCVVLTSFGTYGI